MADKMIPTLTADVNKLTTVLGMPLNFLKDVFVVGLRGFSSPGFFPLLAGLGPLLSLDALGSRHHNRTFPPSRSIWQTTLLCARGGS
jgi:hypothetical protein